MIRLHSATGESVVIQVDGVVWEVREDEDGPVVFDTLDSREAVTLAMEMV